MCGHLVGTLPSALTAELLTKGRTGFSTGPTGLRQILSEATMQIYLDSSPFPLLKAQIPCHQIIALKQSCDPPTQHCWGEHSASLVTSLYGLLEETAQRRVGLCSRCAEHGPWKRTVCMLSQGRGVESWVCSLFVLQSEL